MISLELLKNSQKVLLNLVCNMCSVIKFREKIITTSARSPLVNQVSSLLSGCKNPQNVKLTLIYLCCNLPTPEEVGPPAWGGHRTTMVLALYIYILFQVKSLWNSVPFLIHWVPIIYMLSSFYDIEPMNNWKCLLASSGVFQQCGWWGPFYKPPMASFTKGVNPRLAKRPLVNFLEVKEATGHHQPQYWLNGCCTGSVS